MHPTISTEEKLFRKVITNPNFWKTEEGRPSSALFKDSLGVSVDRDGGRDRETIVSTFKARFGNDNIRAIVYVDARFCYDIATHLLSAPVDGNEFHAEIHDSSVRVQLSGGKAKKLANNCHVVYENPTY
ncbi:hypothetical protein FZW96_07860 [Bacillus sp. BGMRC 2118]|nr:hypothetical protein FZW96_07860 [Bacillus sp. BGMRC 2118]